MTTKPISILIADDDFYCRLGITNVIKQFGIVTEVTSAAEAIKLINSSYFDLAIVDMQMEEEASGIKILQAARKKELPTIILSSYDEDELTEKSYDLGCLHFLNKLHYKSHLEDYVSKFIKKRKSNHFLDILKSHYITQDQEIIQKLKMLYEMNLKDKCIFIAGETGVGKSQIGKIIHQMQSNDKKPFVHLNCSEISDNLIESEFFGHVKGAFTGANSDKKGKLELANGGTLFLDEIGTMPLKMQQKLLKALDEKVFYAVGGSTPIKANFTLVTATCDDLLDKIAKGEFRKDLFFRISGINLEIKPLRQRKDDIHLLIKYFLQHLPRRVVLRPDVTQALLSYSWPGNIRELKKTIEYLGTLNVGIITKDLIPQNHFTQKEHAESLLTPDHLQFIEEYGFRKLIEKMEKEAVQFLMQKHSGKLTSAIKEMQISNSAFYRILGQQ